MKILELTLPGDQGPVFVNMNRVIYFQASDEGSRLFLQNHRSEGTSVLVVRQSPDQIIKELIAHAWGDSD